MDDRVQAAAPAAAARRNCRGRPLASATAERDAYILEVAERLFLEHGFRQVSLAMIARAASIATRTIYTRFGGKRGMLDRILEKRSGCENFATALAQAGNDPTAALHRLALHAFDHVLSAPLSLLQADAMATRTSHAGTSFQHLYDGSWYHTLVAVLDDGRWGLAAAHVDDIGLMADLFIGCLLREVSSASREGKCIQDADISKALADRTLRRFLLVARPWPYAGS